MTTSAQPNLRTMPTRSADVVRALRDGSHRTVDVGHSRVATWRFGRGPDLVFVHGWPLHSATFRHIVPALSRHFTCHLFDLPYAGRTQTRDQRIGITGYGDTIEAVVDALGIDRYAMIAHDSGAMMARIVAARHRDRVQALVMGNTEIPGHTPWQLAMYIASARLPGGSYLLRAALRSRIIRHSSAGFGGCFVDPSYADGEFSELFVEPLVSGRDLRALKLMQHLSKREMNELPETHAKIVAPTQLVWGPSDPFFPVTKAKPMLEQFAGPAHLEVLEEGKLFAHEDRPEAFVARALPFLQEHLAADQPQVTAAS